MAVQQQTEIPPRELNTKELSSIETINTVSSNEEEPTGFLLVRKRIRRVVQHFAFRAINLFLILADIIILIIDFNQSETWHADSPYDIITMCFVIYFFIEVNLRLFALGPSEFSVMWYNVIDYIIVVISLIIYIVSAAVESFSHYAKLIIVGRLVRIIIFFRIIAERKHLAAGMRMLVSQNKRRYQKEGFDLDLTYITDRIIAMSFPSTGSMSLYRNPMKEVVRFLDKMHANHYMIYNLCSEASYSPDHFHGRVQHFPIDDHNPTTLKEMFRFTKSVKEWLSQDPKNVIAVHCKGGKGRTGMMISVWLIESGYFNSAPRTLDFVGNRRTDRILGKKYQGVNTPSQNRYVNYYCFIKDRLGGRLPEHVVLKLEKLTMYSIKGIGNGNGSDFTWEIRNGQQESIFWCPLNRSTDAAEVHYYSEEDYMEANLLDGPLLEDDVIVVLHCSSKSVPCEVKDIVAYFWFHTAFVENFRLVLHRNSIDNLHKSKMWTLFTKNFKVDLVFSKV